MSNQPKKSLPSSSHPAKNTRQPHASGVADGTHKEDATFTLRVINTMNYKQTKLTVNKAYTIADVHEAYSSFEDHPEYYVWKDMHGRTLDPLKTLVQNGIVGKDEVVEFDGIGKEPCVLMIFKDGMEDEPQITLNPAMQNRRGDKQKMCRNY